MIAPVTDAANRFWVGTSWKMNKTLAQAQAFCDAIRDAPVLADPRLQPFVIPPFTAVREVKRWLVETPVLVGAQTMHWADEGAWTGEISPSMLVDCGLDLVELGHSERRMHFGETDETVGLKVAACLRHGLTPLICIGESAEDKRAGRADAVLERQVRGALAGVATASDSGPGSGVNSGPLLFAYEPVWAIGEGGTPATADYVAARHGLILQVARAQCPDRAVACFYGGSVNPENCAELAGCPQVGGLFVGRSAWDARGYLDIVARTARALDAA